MRSKEWYGWHFPELSKIISDNTAYIRTVLAIGLFLLILIYLTILFDYRIEIIINIDRNYFKTQFE
jgi:RNA processing factor Prp31